MHDVCSEFASRLLHRVGPKRGIKELNDINSCVLALDRVLLIQLAMRSIFALSDVATYLHELMTMHCDVRLSIVRASKQLDPRYKDISLLNQPHRTFTL